MRLKEKNNTLSSSQILLCIDSAKGEIIYSSLISVFKSTVVCIHLILSGRNIETRKILEEKQQ